MIAVVRNRKPPAQAVTGMWMLVVGGAYFVAAELGLQLALVRGQVTPLWPPTGIALACLVLLGIRVWPGIAVAAFLVNLAAGSSALASAGISVGNTLAPVCAYLLLKRVKFRPELDRLRDALALVFLGAFGGMLISAAIGTGVLVLSGGIPAGHFMSVWSVWWTGDAMGVLTVAPLLLVARSTRWPRGARAMRWSEGAALIAGTFAVALIATTGPVDLSFLVFPFLIWAALRFQHIGALPCALVASTVTILAAAHGTGPFADLGLTTKMITLQAFNGSVALTALLLAAVMSERNQARLEVERACDELSGLVSQLAPGWALDGLVIGAHRNRSRAG
ncbi:MASE1 domain-containing protein [Amycolatopsis anabasis]|uniref:MASE1 domain-containing protein n=1 Tax=Amycolatopsis anabasis TaxID=1840409 RepID=UPI00131A773F|nr:MASE1 domain-containing protein [Amycolatopsis anabasis]